jgi:hypothetical protein
MPAGDWRFARRPGTIRNNLRNLLHQNRRIAGLQVGGRGETDEKSPQA